MEVDVILIRRSPVLSVLKLLAIDIIVSVLYSSVVMGLDITEGALFGESKLFGYDLVFFMCYTLIIILFTFFIMLSWSFDSYEIRSGEILHKFGVFRKSQEQYSLSNTENITLTQGILGRIFKYGTIIIYNPLLKTEIRITGIIDPDAQFTLIKKAILRSDQSQKIIPAL